MAKQLEIAESIFLLHLGISLNQLWVRCDRAKFCGLLDKFWTKFADCWDVLLHGNPSASIYGGIKLASGGELGIGVGEEDWGSGEREVLENLASNTKGLVDMVVSRFGNPSIEQTQDASKQRRDATKSTKPIGTVGLEDQLWSGSGRYPQAADGVIFSGLGRLSRRYVRSLSGWIEWIYMYGDYAYGVKDNPGTSRRKGPRPELIHVPSYASQKVRPEEEGPGRLETSKSRRADVAVKAADPGHPEIPRIPPPIVAAAEDSLKKANSAASSRSKQASTQIPKAKTAFADSEKWMKVLTLGFGNPWASGEQSDTRPPGRVSSEVSRNSQQGDARKSTNSFETMKSKTASLVMKMKLQAARENKGYFAIGFQGELEDEEVGEVNGVASGEDGNAEELNDWESRTSVRTVYAEVDQEYLAEDNRDAKREDEVCEDSSRTTYTSHNRTRCKVTRLQVIVYIVSHYW